MTFKEKLQKEYPDKVRTGYTGGCSGCPDSYGYEKCSDYCRVRDGMPRRPSDERCTACWNREIPGTNLRGLRARIHLIDELHGVPNLTENAKNIIKKTYLNPSDVEKAMNVGSFITDGIKRGLRDESYELQRLVYATFLNAAYGAPKVYIPDIKKVIFNDPATIVIWADGEKTVVKCQNGEPYDPEKGLAMAITKRALGNKGNYFDEIKKWTSTYDVESAYPEIVEIHMDETESNKLEELVRGMVKRRIIGRDEV